MERLYHILSISCRIDFMQKIAIIGAGFVGLAAAFYLADRFQVTLFDHKGIGGGASGISSGLLHPYPGEKGRRSWHADEAMAATRELLKVAESELGRLVADYGGIVREGECQGKEEDVELLPDGRFLIRSGITVFPRLYLEGLWKACEKKGVELMVKKVGALQELDGYDYKVIAAGAKVREFAHVNVNFVKGQVLTCQLEEPLQRSVAAKRYLAMTEDPMLGHLGATYEREFADDLPCVETAIKLLEPKLKVVGCRAGVRVTNPAHYFPILEQVNATTWVMTAFGSRGLLYHAYFGQKLASVL
jgi:glycine/D-amino acid oxidase-like deaminating enzyme